ncbi:glycerate kinase [Chironomus tepperi]|uniref:glycerate kinase n=1 Tax=Chironomus tepperi TaxID=113505 RepID=UPI00391F0755
MRQILSVILNFKGARCYCSGVGRYLKMEDVLKNIFYSSVDSVKPRTLISGNNFIVHKTSGSKELIEINHQNSSYQLDITKKNIHIVGFGKGVLGIAAEIERVLGNRITDGILSIPVGAQQHESLSSTTKLKVYEGAAGNLPDNDALKAAEAIKDHVSSLTCDDILFCLITGGGSSLLPLPITPITLDEKSLLIKRLSRAGATINELNIVRIAISQVKGGKLLEIGKNVHKIISLIISDIINDPLELIASGPTILYQKPAISPLKILEKYNLMDTLPQSIVNVIQKNEDNQDVPSMIKKNSQVFLIANNHIAIESAMNKAKSFNLVPVFLSHEVQGNVIDISKAFFDLACCIKMYSTLSRDEFLKSIEHVLDILHAHSNFHVDLINALNQTTINGICIISGGETTVNVQCDEGLGGRNQELALRFTKHCYDTKSMEFDDLLFLSAGTDGIDGNNDAAGAIGGTKILSNMNENDLNVSDVMADYIYRNDSYSFYKNFIKNYAGDGYHIHTGITGTNVMDIHLLLMIMPNARLS